MKGETCHVVLEDQRGRLRRIPVPSHARDAVFAFPQIGFALRVPGGWWRMKGQEARS